MPATTGANGSGEPSATDQGNRFNLKQLSKLVVTARSKVIPILTVSNENATKNFGLFPASDHHDARVEITTIVRMANLFITHDSYSVLAHSTLDSNCEIEQVPAKAGTGTCQFNFGFYDL